MSKELKLYEAAAEFADILYRDDFGEEEIAELDKLQHCIEEKAANILTIADDFEAFANRCKEEEQRLANRRKAAENRVKSLKHYLQRNMEQAGIMDLKLDTKTAKLQKNPPAVVIDNEADIPSRFYVIVPETYRLDKVALKDALKKEKVKGAHLEQGLSLRVR